MSEYAVIESMTKFQWFGHNVRVWREEEEILDRYDNSDLEKALSMGMSNIEVAKTLANMPRVNAVEVIDSGGNGLVLYREWP